MKIEPLISGHENGLDKTSANGAYFNKQGKRNCDEHN
jgi:hypothetical protein